MRVAYVCADPGVPVFGGKGASVHVQEVVRALLRRGARVELIASRLGGPPAPGIEDARVHRLPRPAGDDPAERERSGLTANAALAGVLRALGPVELVYERYSLWSYAAMEHARRAGVPRVLEVNAPLVEEAAAHRGLVDRESAELVARRAARAATSVIAVSRPAADWIARLARPCAPVQVVPNGVDPGRFPAVRSFGSAPRRRARARPFTVGFLGTLKPWHGLDVLAAGFAMLRTSLPGARLLVVGDGPERAPFEADLAARGLAGSAWLSGAVAPDRVPARLASMDVGVAPYPPLEGFYFSPLKVLEYLAAGLPVVASRVGQVAELIEDGETGLLCPPGDAVALGDALARLARDPGLRRRLGAAGRDRVLADHTWDAACERILASCGLDSPPTAGAQRGRAA